MSLRVRRALAAETCARFVSGEPVFALECTVSLREAVEAMRAAGVTAALIVVDEEGDVVSCTFPPKRAAAQAPRYRRLGLSRRYGVYGRPRGVCHAAAVVCVAPVLPLARSRANV